MAKQYDLVVLGAGIGGYVAAIRASQLGMKVALVEKEQVGGVCLHRGCIPSKTLLKSAELLHEIKHSEQYGISVSNIAIDFSMMQTRKNQVIQQLHSGLKQLLAHHQIEIYQGTGRILGASIFSPQPGTISVQMDASDENEILVPQFVLIATGSKPRSLANFPVDGEIVCFSDHLLEMEALPASIVIVGGGVIGIEWASLLNDLGVQVTIVEAAPRILPFEDEEISQTMHQSLAKRQVKIFTNVAVKPEWIVTDQGERFLQIAGEQIPAERVLISVGREANSAGIGLQNTAIQQHNGFIQVNEMMQTAESHIYAVGDVIGGYQLAHVAAREALIAVDHMNNQEVSRLDPGLVPRCTYSRPEVASMGLSESDALEAGFAVKVAKVPFARQGKAAVLGKTEGFIKLVSDQQTDDLLGVHIIGAQATELIASAGLAKLLDATAWEMAQPIYAHPTLSEVLGEVGLAIDGAAIHVVNAGRKG